MKFKRTGQIAARNTLHSTGSRVSFVLTLGSLFLGSMLSACSPGMFFGDDIDKGVKGTKGYREINWECSGLKISSNILTVTESRDILRCFNSNGGLKEIAQLVDMLPDRMLQPLVDWGNRYVLNNRKLMYEIEGTYFALQRKGLLDSTFRQFGRLIENEEFVASGIALLKESVYPDGSPVNLIGKDPDPRLLKTIKKLSTKINVESLLDGLDAGITLGDSRSFLAIQDSFKGENALDFSLEQLTGMLHRYLFDIHHDGRPDFAKELLIQVRSGLAFEAVDRILGKQGASALTEEQIRQNASRASGAMRLLFSNQGELFDGVTSLFSALNGPIRCLRGTQQVPNAIRWAIDELVEQRGQDEAIEFVRRQEPLVLTSLGPFCDYPAGLAEHHSVLKRLADSNGFRPLLETMKVLNGIHEGGRKPLLDLMIEFLTDIDGGTGTKRLIPVLAELTERGIWEDGLLIASLPRIEDRDKIRNAVSFVLERDEDLGGEGVYDILTDIVSRTSVLNLFRFAKSLGKFAEEDEPIVAPGLAALRSAIFVNEAHPFIDLLRGIMETAPEKGPLYNSLFAIATDYPEFGGAVRLASRMAKDGRLTRLLGGVITLFHKWAAEGAYGPINDGLEKPFVAKRRHNWDRHDLDKFWLENQNSDVSSACGQLDLTFKIDGYSSSPAKFNHELDLALQCLNSRNDFEDVVSGFEYLRDRVGPLAAKPFLHRGIDLMKDLSGMMNDGEVSWLVDRFKAAFDDGRLDRLLKASPYFLTHQAAGEGGSFARAALDLARPLLGQEIPLNFLKGAAADIVMEPELPRVLGLGEEIYDHPMAAENEIIPEYNVPAIKSALYKYECHTNPTPGNQNVNWERVRSRQVVQDYTDGVSSWELVNGRSRKMWPKDMFRACIGGPEPGKTPPAWCSYSLFEKFADKSQSVDGRSLISSAVNVLKYFSLEPGQSQTRGKHFTPEYLAEWFARKSDDYRIIPYFFPGEPKPRLRLVNTLDRLELILINADLELSSIPKFMRNLLGGMMGIEIPENGAKHFLALIGEAWGDEPESMWPLEIRAKYANRRPQTLAQAVGELKRTLTRLSNFMGYPELPNCAGANWPTTNNHLPDWLVKAVGKSVDPHLLRSSLFNLKYVLSAVDDMLEDGDGRVNSMKVLRDLFFEFHNSTPAQFRNSGAGYRNNLTVVLHLVRFGLTRQASRLLRGFSPDDPYLRDFFRSLVMAAKSPYAVPALESLFTRDFENDPDKPFKDRLLWKVLDSILTLIQDPALETLSSARIAQLEKHECTEDQDASLRTEWNCERMHMRQLAFGLVGMLGQKKPADEGGGFALGGRDGAVSELVKTLRDILRAEQGFLLRHADKIQAPLRWRDLSGWVRALHENEDWVSKSAIGDTLKRILSHSSNGLSAVRLAKAVLDDPKADAAWDAMKRRFDSIEAEPAYEALDLSGILRDVLHFFQEDRTRDCAKMDEGSSAWSSELNAQCKFRRFGARFLRGTDLNDLLRLVAGRAISMSGDTCQPEDLDCGPEKFDQLLRMLGTRLERGDLDEFLALARRSLSN